MFTLQIITSNTCCRVHFPLHYSKSGSFPLYMMLTNICMIMWLSLKKGYTPTWLLRQRENDNWHGFFPKLWDQPMYNPWKTLPKSSWLLQTSCEISNETINPCQIAKSALNHDIPMLIFFHRSHIFHQIHLSAPAPVRRAVQSLQRWPAQALSWRRPQEARPVGMIVISYLYLVTIIDYQDDITQHMHIYIYIYIMYMICADIEMHGY